MSTPALDPEGEPAVSYAGIIHPDKVGRRLGIPLPLSEDDHYTVSQALSDAQSDLEAYLGRPVVPVTYTDHHRTPNPWTGTWHLDNYPVISITSVTPETAPDGLTPTGLYMVTYVAGLDGANDPELEPIRRYILIHAIYDPAVQILFRTRRPDIALVARTASVEGQSATLTDAYPSTAAGMRSAAGVTAQLSLPGSPPTLQTCDRWRLGKRRVHQRPPRWGDTAPWPYDLPVEGTGDIWAGRWVTWW